MTSNPSQTKHVLSSQVEGRRRGDFSREQARSVSGGWAALDDKTIVPVFLPAVFVMFGAYGEFLPVADRRQTLRGDPHGRKIIFCPFALVLLLTPNYTQRFHAH